MAASTPSIGPSDAVARRLGALLGGAVRAAEQAAVGLDAVADHADAAVLAGRRQRVDRALEAVEGVRGARRGHLDGLVVVVAADLTLRHGLSSVGGDGPRFASPCFRAANAAPAARGLAGLTRGRAWSSARGSPDARQ